MSLFMRWHKLLGNDSMRDSAFAIFVFPLGIVIFVAMTTAIYQRGGILPILGGSGILAAIVVASVITTIIEEKRS